MALIEFAYDNNYNFSIEMTSYEALYGRLCRTSICWNESVKKKLVGPRFI